MKLCEIYIEGFGKLSGARMRFSDGLNVLKRENGFGKTTLAVFIKAMLYGLDSGKKQSVTESDRRHYLPWSGGRCGGSLVFEAEGKRYRIERTFGKKEREDTFKLYDERTGKESFAYSERIGEELFGVDEGGFLGTVFLGEEELSDGAENKTVMAKLTNLSGCDGDISSLDKALLALEDVRKLYYKRGGGGEIAETSARIAALDGRIGELTRLKAELRENEERLSASGEEIKRAKRERELERERAAEAGALRERRLYAKQYSDMLRAVREDEERLRELEIFFGGQIPAPSLLEDMKRKEREAALLVNEPVDAEEETFGEGVSELEYSRARELSERIPRLEGEISALKDQIGSKSRVTDLPPCEEIGAIRDKLRLKAVISAAIPLGAIILFSACLLGHFVNGLAYLAALSALPLIVFGAVRASARRKKKKEGVVLARELIKRVTGMDVSGERLIPTVEELYRLAKENERSESESEALSERLNSLLAEASALEDEARRFIGKFDIPEGNTLTGMINTILERRSASLALSGAMTAKGGGRERALLRSAELRREVLAFLAPFKTVTERPLDEISSKLIEREALLRSLERTRESVRSYGAEHGLTDDIAESILSAEPSRITYSAAASDELPRLEASRALLSRRNEELIFQISALDDLILERDSLLSKKAELEARLSIVTKTKDLLISASDDLTARYLGKTKEAFARYITLISGAIADGVSLDTSFNIKKIEGGEYKEAENYSRGTRDLFALALRLALVESLYEGERPFIILDDPFAHFDDTALAGAKAALLAIAKEKQILYLTCSEVRAV